MFVAPAEKKLVLKNELLRYRDFKIFGPFLAKNDLFSFIISKNPLGIPVFVIFYGLARGSAWKTNKNKV